MPAPTRYNINNILSTPAPPGTPGPPGAPGAPGSAAALTNDVNVTGNAATVLGFFNKPLAAGAATPSPQTCLAYVGGSYNPVSLKSVFNVLSYGAVADNVTDNQPAIQAAIAAAAPSGGEVYFPLPASGNFYGVSSPVLISGEAGAVGVRLFGDSCSSDSSQQPRIRAITSAGSQFAPNTGTGAFAATYAVSGTGATIASVVGTAVTLTGLSGLVQNAFSVLTIFSATNAGNVGLWGVATFISSTSVVITIPAGAVVESGSISWNVTGVNAPNGHAVVLSGLSASAVAKVSIGDRVQITNAVNATNNTYSTIIAIPTTTSLVYIFMTGCPDNSNATRAFTSPDAGLTGGLNYSLKKPLIKCWARGASIERLYLDGANSCSECISATNDAHSLVTSPVTNLRFYYLNLQNALFGIMIGDSGGSVAPCFNVEFGDIYKVYTQFCTVAGIAFYSLSGQQKGWRIAFCSFYAGKFGIYQNSGSFAAANNAFTSQTVSCYAIGQYTDNITTEADEAESCARYMQIVGNNGCSLVTVSSLRFDSQSMTDNSVIKMTAPMGLVINGATCNTGNNVPTNLVSAYGGSAAFNNGQQVAVRINGPVSMGGNADLVVANAGSGGVVYEVSGDCVANPGGVFFQYPEGRFQINAETAGLLPAVPPVTIANLAQGTWQFASGVIASGANNAIPYQGYSQMELHADPGGSYSLNGMLPAPPCSFGGVPQESAFSFFLYPPRQVTVAHLDSNAAAGRRFVVPGGGAGGAGGGASSIVVAAPAAGGYVEVAGRYSFTADPVALAGAATVTATNGSTAITFSSAQTLKAFQWITIAGIYYRVAAATTASTSATLITVFTGTTGAGQVGQVCNGAWVVTKTTTATATSYVAPTGTGIPHITAGAQDVAAVHGTADQLFGANHAGTDATFFTLGGDGTIASGVLTIGKVNSTSYPAGGALTTGNSPYVSGASAVTYQALNLAGGAGWVTGVLPTANQAAQTLAGDCTGTTAANTVVALTGAASVLPIASTAAVLKWAAGTVAPGLTQLAPTSDVATTGLSIAAQPAFASATTNQTGGVLNLSSGVGVGTHAYAGGAACAFVNIQVAGTTVASWSNNGNSTSGDSCSFPNGFIFNGQSATIGLRAGTSINLSPQVKIGRSIGATDLTISTGAATSLVFDNTVTTSISISQTAAASTSSSSGAAGVPILITGQAGQPATGASNNGGNGAQVSITGGNAGTSGSATRGSAGSVVVTGGGPGANAGVITVGGLTATGAGGLISIAAGGSGVESNPGSVFISGWGVSVTSSVGVTVDGGPSGAVLLQNGSTASSLAVTQTGLAYGQVAIALTTGTVTLSTLQKTSPLHVYTGTLTGNITLDFGGIAGCYHLDFSGVTLGGFTISIKNGTITTVVTSLITAFKTLLIASMSAVNKLSVG